MDMFEEFLSLKNKSRKVAILVISKLMYWFILSIVLFY